MTGQLNRAERKKAVKAFDTLCSITKNDKPYPRFVMLQLVIEAKGAGSEGAAWYILSNANRATLLNFADALPSFLEKLPNDEPIMSLRGQGGAP